MDSGGNSNPVGNTSPGTAPEATKQRRVKSELAFPYSDIHSALEMCRKIQEKAGTSCEIAQLAAWMDQSVDGGTFRSRLGAARLFGFVETQQSRVSLMPLGRNALDSTRVGAALAEAFLNVPLYRAMYEEYEGYALPPAAAIERQMEHLGVPSKQKDRARQTFVKSAQHAAFIDPHNGKLIKPAFMPAPAPPSADDAAEKSHGGGSDDGGRGDGLDLDPLLIALLKKIPPQGSEWPASQRVRWFRTFAMNVSQVYDNENSAVDLEITEVRSDIPSRGISPRND